VLHLEETSPELLAAKGVEPENELAVWLCLLARQRYRERQDAHCHQRGD
jgi:hypothetical protein